MATPKALQMTPQSILTRPYERVLIPEEEGGYSAYIPEFEGCFAQGETAEEALSMLHETAIAWLEAELEEGKAIPEPWNSQQFNGKLLLRLPKSLHRDLARQAEREMVSLNQYVVHKLAASAREDQLVNRLSDLLASRAWISITTSVAPNYVLERAKPVSIPMDFEYARITSTAEVVGGR